LASALASSEVRLIAEDLLVEDEPIAPMEHSAGSGKDEEFRKELELVRILSYRSWCRKRGKYIIDIEIIEEGI
jgi:hypothetical protein